MRLYMIAAVFLGLLSGARCGRTTPVTERGVLVPEDSAGNVILFISNQDRAVDPLDVRVDLDGSPIIRAKIAIGEVHPSYEQYQFNWAPGIHEIRVESTGVPATLISKVAIDGRRWVSILYGYPPHQDAFVLSQSDEPLAWK